MRTDLGLVSNQLADDEKDKGSTEDNDLLLSIENYTEKVSKLFFPSEQARVQQNRLNQHLLLTQQVMVNRRKHGGEPSQDSTGTEKFSDR